MAFHKDALYLFGGQVGRGGGAVGQGGRRETGGQVIRQRGRGGQSGSRTPTLGTRSTLMSCTAWACLVQDELGAQSTLMYRLGLPPGDNYTNARPEWAEWDAELPYNRSRSCTIFQGSLSVFQVWKCGQVGVWGVPSGPSGMRSCRTIGAAAAPFPRVTLRLPGMQVWKCEVQKEPQLYHLPGFTLHLPLFQVESAERSEEEIVVMLSNVAPPPASLLQLGSNALGRANDEDAEKGLVYLDVFKHSRLDALKPREVDEEEMKPKNGMGGECGARSRYRKQSHE